MARPERTREESAPDSDALFKTAVRARFEQAEAAAHAASRERNPVESAKQTEIANACARLLNLLP
ncbi:MAG: hypothetical protein M0T84_01495 [Betaproteobacteria bacterium]|nr:hypothetical protein [Betaproteobacteria bacterium]